mmetsp:Transcript_16280/g.54551  ORF Transcript_16280/g.54551 Transcript_16280/m.54551 type:complete len:164 (-) Transcript_16280:53-544(-)
MFFEKRVFLLLLGNQGLSVLSLLLILIFPNLAIGLHLSQVWRHFPFVIVLLSVSHLLVFLGNLYNDASMGFSSNVVKEALKADLLRCGILLALYVTLMNSVWWLIDLYVCIAIIYQVIQGIIMAQFLRRTVDLSQFYHELRVLKGILLSANTRLSRKILSKKK